MNEHYLTNQANQLERIAGSLKRQSSLLSESNPQLSTMQAKRSEELIEEASAYHEKAKGGN